MNTETLRTAICTDTNGTEHKVECLIWTNDHGASCLRRTRERLAADHPDLTFAGWVFDLTKSAHRNDLACAFLSPQVAWTERYVRENGRVLKRRVYRAEVA